MKVRTRITSQFAAVLLATAIVAPVTAYADPGPARPGRIDEAPPKGFASWAELFAVQGPLVDAGLEIQRVAATRSGSGFADFTVDAPGRSLKVYWQGRPSPAEQHALDLARAGGLTVTVQPARYSREQLTAQVELIRKDAGKAGRRIHRITPQPDGSGIQVEVDVAGSVAPGVANAPVLTADTLGDDLSNLRQAVRNGGVTVVARRPSTLYGRELDTAPFWGGSLIWTQDFSPAKAFCSTGFAANQPDLNWTLLMTAEHCSLGYLNVNWRSGPSNNVVGRSEDLSSDQDAMFINSTFHGNSAATIYDGPAAYAPGSTDKNVVGAVHIGNGAFVCISGSLTGIDCNVKVVNASAIECSYPYCITVVNAESQANRGIVQHGDSGGPVFVNAFNNSAALAVGLIHSGYGTEHQCSNPLYLQFDGQPAKVGCSQGITFTDVIFAVKSHPGRRLTTKGGQPSINGDDRADVLGTTGTGDVLVYPNVSGDGGLGAFQTIGTGWGGYNMVRLADFNSDGRTDVLGRAASNGNLHLYLNAGGSGFGTLLPMDTVGTGWGGFNELMVGDFTKDGRADVLGRDAANGNLLLYTNTGGWGVGTFTGPTTVGTGWGGFDRLRAGDLTGDGRADVLGRDAANGNLLLYTNTGGSGIGTLTGPTTIGTGWGGFNDFIVGDINGDGRADVVGRATSNGNLLRYTNTGGSGLGTLTGPTTIGTGWGGFSNLSLG